MFLQLLKYFKQRKKYWLIPLLLIFIIFAVAIIIGPASPYSPFIYTVF